MKKYILTGGPGTGKSTLILALEKQGEHIIKEAAEDHIKLRQAQGQPEPWTEPDFQDEILDLQIQREQRIPKEAERVFIDRGATDGLAYAQPGTEIYKRLLQEAKTRKYEKVFLIETLGTTEKTEVRRENHEEAVKLAQKLEQIYKYLGYEVIRIPVGTVQERLEKILKETNL